MRRAFFCLTSVLALCAPLAATAQTGSAVPAVIPAQPSAPAANPPDVSKEALVFDKLITHIREESDGTGTRQTTVRVRILADAGVKDMAVLAFTYTASNQQVDIGYVRVIKPDGSVVVTPDYNVQDMPADVSREAPMYSDIHQKHVAVRGLGVGDTLEYQITLRTLKPEIPGQFWFEYTFEKNLIILDEELDLDVPADKAVTVASADVQPTVTAAGDRKTYHWASSNLKRPDPDAPPKSVKNWKPSIEVTTFSSWEQIGAWYASLQKNSLTITPAIQARADKLTKGLTSDEDKVQAIFNDVALHVHYVALEFGIGRYKPHAADDVLANEYGDCKDKHTLLAALLKAEGIEAWPVLISDSRYLDPATPSPAQFDHVITVVPFHGKLMWMDSTEEIAPVGVLASTLRGKKVLAIPPDKPAYLEHTPDELPFRQSAQLQVEGKLSDQGVFTAHFAESFHGDAELGMRSAFRSVPQSQWKEFLQGVSNATGFGGEVSNPEVSPIDQTGQPLHFSYDYRREKFGQWDDRRISPPLPPVGWETVPGVKQIEPADDIDTGGPGDQDYRATVQIPSGWLLFPPQSIDLTEDWAEYHARYIFKDGTFTAERRLLIKKNKIPLADWDKYLAFRRSIFEDESRTEPIEDSDHRAEGIESPGAPQLAYSEIPRGAVTTIGGELTEAIIPLRNIALVLQDDRPLSAGDLAKLAANSRDAMESIEAKSTTLPEGDAHALYWAQALSYAWCIHGWIALRAQDVQTAESYLATAWTLSQDRLSGYLLGRALEVKRDKLAAARQYKLAYIAGASSPFPAFSAFEFDLDKRSAEGFRRVTGKQLQARALNLQGTYQNSLQAQLDSQTEIHTFVRSTKLTGSGLFSVAFEHGKPVKVSFLGGDKGFAELAPALQAHRFPPQLPPGSKARVLREVNIICSPWAGCDAYILLTGSLKMPIRLVDITPPNAPKGTKTMRAEELPVTGPQ